MNLQSYDDVVSYLEKKRRSKHLLLGNGFSMAYDPNIFSYTALNKFIDELDDELLRKLFEIINTKNFEIVMQQLDNFVEIAKAFSSDNTLIQKIKKANTTLKQSLINAVKSLHPEHVFKIPDSNSSACAKFLSKYLQSEGNVFTTNYDILLYWVLMRNTVSNSIDGFGRYAEETGEYIPEDDLEYSELTWGKHKEKQNIHYLHGALPLFDTGIEIVKEEYDGQHFLLENINKRVEQKEYPIFITAGDGQQKLAHIMHNKYLTFCYEKLSSIEGSLISFGFNFGEYDDHIIEAINVAAKHGKPSGNKLFSIYIGVYSDAGKKHIESIKSKFKCKVNLYDTKTANVWGL